MKSNVIMDLNGTEKRIEFKCDSETVIETALSVANKELKTFFKGMDVKILIRRTGQGSWVRIATKQDVLDYLKINGESRNADIGQAFNISYVPARRILRQLIAEGKVIKRKKHLEPPNQIHMYDVYLINPKKTKKKSKRSKA